MPVKPNNKQNESEYLKPYINILKDFNNPAAVLDTILRCIWCSDKNILTEGEFFTKYASKAVYLPIESFNQISFFKGGKSYCVRIIPIKPPEHDKIFLCEFFDYNASLNVMKKSVDTYSANNITMSLNSAFNELWNMIAEFEENRDNSNYDKILEIEKTLISVNSISRNYSEYFSFSRNKIKETYFDLYDLLNEMVLRCNDITADIDRKFLISAEDERFIVCADIKLLTAAFTNAIQNALLYSKENSCPEIILKKVKSNNSSRALVLIKNEITPVQASEFNNSNPFQSLGIPIIKQTVNICGGDLSLSCSRNEFCLNISLPAFENCSLSMNNPLSAIREKSGPDYLTLKMRDTVNILLKENNDNHIKNL